ncbi:tyrosine-type recombinase/integrase [Williamsia muralis]|uniref:tyrosine-type recombinase/integrase n=1 Tax=Williamsia marianensis TaxID=85044 RepID=UPI000E327BC4|nr:tyrosine-type recombinase/integrase [Williamsia marianensis]
METLATRHRSRAARCLRWLLVDCLARAAISRGRTSTTTRRARSPAERSRRSSRPAISDAGVADLVGHDFRHFFASGLIAAGVDVVAVSKAMGHSSAAFTLNTYAHLWPKSMTKSGSRQRA